MFSDQKSQVRTELLLLVEKDIKDSKSLLLINGKTPQEIFKVPSYRIELECEQVVSGFKLCGSFVEYKIKALKHKKQSAISFKSQKFSESNSSCSESEENSINLEQLEGDLNRLRLRQNIKLLNARKIKFTAPIQENLLTSKDIFKNERAYNNYKKLNLMGTNLKNGNLAKGGRRSGLSPSNSKSSQKKRTKGSVTFSPEVMRINENIKMPNLNRKSCKETSKYIINLEHMADPFTILTSRSDKDKTDSIVLKSPRRNHPRINFLSDPNTSSKFSGKIAGPTRKYPNSCIRLSKPGSLRLAVEESAKEVKTPKSISKREGDFVISGSKKMIIKKTMDIDEWIKWNVRNRMRKGVDIRQSELCKYSS